MRACSEKCNQCLFTKDKIVSDECKAELLRELKHNGKHFFCHKGTIKGENIICKGSIEAGFNIDLFNAAQAMGMIKYVKPEEI